MSKQIHGVCRAVAIIMIGFVNQVSAEPFCYTVSGSIATENINSNLQIGNINLILNDSNGEVVFNETGSLVGNITGTDGVGTTFMSHVARFPKGDSFNTEGDKATLSPPYVRLYDAEGNLLLDEEGNPCSFFIHETINNITRGTGIFKNTTSGTEVAADGYISYCPGENENSFELSGDFCTE